MSLPGVFGARLDFLFFILGAAGRRGASGEQE